MNIYRSRPFPTRSICLTFGMPSSSAVLSAWHGAHRVCKFDRSLTRSGRSLTGITWSTCRRSDEPHLAQKGFIRRCFSLIDFERRGFPSFASLDLFPQSRHWRIFPLFTLHFNHANLTTSSFPHGHKTTTCRRWPSHGAWAMIFRKPNSVPSAMHEFISASARFLYV